MPVKDPVAMKAYQKAWAERNKERRKKERREHYLLNKEKVLAQSKEYYLAHQEEIRARQDAHQQTPEYRAMRRKWYQTWNGRYKKQRSCRNRFSSAVRKGIIVPKPCQVCGDTNSEGHHEDYDKPYEVVWLCKYHHKLLEGKIVVPREEPEKHIVTSSDVAPI